MAREDTREERIAGPDDRATLSGPKRGGPSAKDVHRFLAERFGEGVRSVEPIGHGEWSSAFAFRRHGGDYVVRFGAYPEDFAKDRIAAGFATEHLPIPPVLETGEAFGGHFAVSRRMPGAYIDEVDDDRMRALLPSLFAMLDAARGVDLSHTTGYGTWDATGNAPHATWRAALLSIAAENDRLPGWRERLTASPTGIEPFEEAYGRLAELARFGPEERHLIHSDLLHFNVLVEGDRISAVLDWGNALYGDFIYDVAWFAFWAPWFPAWNGIDFAAEAQRHFASIGLEMPHLAERLRCCQVHIGLDNMAYSAFTGNWTQLDAVARLTLAVARGG